MHHWWWWLVAAWLVVNVVISWGAWRSRRLNRRRQGLRSVHLTANLAGTWTFELDERHDRSWTVTARDQTDGRLRSTVTCRASEPPGPDYQLHVDQVPGGAVECRWEWNPSVFDG